MRCLMERLAVALCIASALAACTSEQIENGLAGSAKGWCRNSPQYCTVHDQTP